MDASTVEWLKRKRAEIRADIKKLPHYIDYPDKGEMSGSQVEWYDIARGELKLIAEMLGDECWHESEQVEGGFWKCTKCGGYWRHLPEEFREPELTREQVIAEVTSGI